MKKNFIALAMAAVCFAGTASVPAFAASKFADINDVPWSGADTVYRSGCGFLNLWQDTQKTENYSAKQEIT